MNDKRIELPWAVARTADRTGRFQYTGNVYYYHRTRKEAEATRAALVRQGKYAGDVEHRPGECHQLGWAM